MTMDRSLGDIRKVLALATNPNEMTRLALEREVLEIQQALASRGRLLVRSAVAARLEDLEDNLLDFQPEYVHICGHGLGHEGIAFQDEIGKIQAVTTEQFEAIFKLFKRAIRCVFLNCCFSLPQAQAIAKHVPYVIGTTDAIRDDIARKFSVKFYKAIGHGKTIPFAFNFARAVTANTPDSLIPVLLRRQKTYQGALPVITKDAIEADHREAAPLRNVSLVEAVIVQDNPLIQGFNASQQGVDRPCREERESHPVIPDHAPGTAQASKRAALNHLWNRLEQQREAVIVLGVASCSEGRQEGRPFPDLDTIAKRILEDEGKDGGDERDLRRELRDVLGAWTEGEDDLADFLQKYTSGEPGPAHYYLAALALGLFPDFNTLLFVTLGFDDLMEEAFANLQTRGRPKVKVFSSLAHCREEKQVRTILDQAVTGLRKGVPVILKLFGDLSAASPLLNSKPRVRGSIGSKIPDLFRGPLLLIDCGPDDKPLEDLAFKAKPHGPIFTVGDFHSHDRRNSSVHNLGSDLGQFILEFMEIIRSRNQALLNRVESLLRRLDPGTLYPDCVSITVRAQLASRAALLRVEEKLPRNHVTGHTLVPITRVDTQPDMTAFFRDTRPLLAVIGDSGSGKSTLFYQIHQAGDAFISILYDAHQLQVTRTLAARLARDFMCDEHSLDSLFDQFDKVLSPTFRHLVILIDGINESIELKPATLRFEIEELASRLPRSIKIAYSCRRVYWDTFIRSTSPLPRELYTNSKEFIIGHFSPGEAQDAFCVYQDLYGFVGGYATLSAEFKQRIMDPLMLRMLAEGYAGRELPSFAPAVLIFDAYEKQFRQKFLGSVIPNFLDLLVIAKAEKEASTDHSSDQFYTVEIRTNSQLSLLIQQQLVSQNRPGDPLVLLEDEGILTAVDEEKRAYRFAYDRFFEYLLGKALSPLLTSVAGKDFRECLQMQVQRLSPLHFSYLQALKSEIIRLNIVAPNGPYSMYDPLTLRSLLDHPDAGIVIFTKDLIRELMFEGREDLSSVISRIYDEETANHLLMLDVAPDSPRIIPLAIKGLKGTRELARRCCHILAAFLPDPKMVAVVENALLEELRRESLDTEVAAGLIYYTAALVGAADHNDDDPIPAILDFWRRALDILGWTEVTMRVLVDALVIAIRREGPRFFGENDESAIEYPWTIMPREVKDAALKMVPFMVDPGLKVTQELREILLFFCSAIREWSARSDPTGAERFDYNLEYTIAQWILVQRARNNYEEVKEILEWFVSAGYMRAIEVALSNLESCMLHALRDDRALLRDAYQSMLSWMPLLKQDEDSFYCHLDHPDAFSRNECPIDMIGRVSLLDEFSPKEGPVPFLENWLKSADWRDCRYALICARKEWRHSPIKILRTLDLLDETDEKDREVVTEWLDLILKEIYLVHPRLVEDFFWRKKHKKVDIARIQRIKRHSDVVDPSAVIHPGEPLYKAFFLGPRSRREKVGQWYSGLLRSADLKGFCEALVRGFMTDISEQPPPSSFP